MTRTTRIIGNWKSWALRDTSRRREVYNVRSPIVYLINITK